MYFDLNISLAISFLFGLLTGFFAFYGVHKLKKLLKVSIIVGFLLSGAVGLTYEVLWLRRLSIVFGTTLPAITAILAAFMGGLALGSYIFGKIADRILNPIRLYGFLEISIGLYCLNMPFLFKITDSIHIALYHRMSGSIVIEVIRFCLAIVILTIPCAFMGGTLPVLTRILVKSRDEIGRHISFLYFLNTMGAVVGTVIAGFLAIRYLGSNLTNFIAVLINLGIGLLFIFLSISTRSSMNVNAAEVPQTVPKQKAKLKWLLYLYFICGFLAMACEMAWTRALHLVIGSTVYAFTIMLASYLIGIALGSLFAGKRVDSFLRPVQILGFLITLTGILIAVSIAMISRLPVILLDLFPSNHEHFFLWQTCLFLLGLLVIFPTTASMGFTFPVISRAFIRRTDHVGQGVGELYLWNTTGGIAGSIITGFVLIPHVGSHSTLQFASFIFFVIGTFILFFEEHSRKIRMEITVAAFICIALVASVPQWNPALLDSGVYIYAKQLLNGFEKNRRILFEKEGYHSYVTVSTLGNIRSLRINGKTDGSDGGDLKTQILLAQLPLLHQQNPDKALVIGLGTGITLGSALTFPGLKVDCVEIDEGVIEASRFFNHVSRNPLSDPDCKLIQADARTVLETATEKYDAIISEPSNPWITGVSNLFTLEHFKSCAHSLKKDGIMCQWIHSYYMGKNTLLTIFQTFQQVFPYCSLWAGSPGDYLILGKQHAFSLNRSNVRRYLAYPQIKKELADISIFSINEIYSHKILDINEFDKMVSSEPKRINSDDKPYVEFNAPLDLFKNTVSTNQDFILQFKSKNNAAIIR